MHKDCLYYVILQSQLKLNSDIKNYIRPCLVALFATYDDFLRDSEKSLSPSP